MRWVLVVLAALVIIIVVALTVGMLLPREHRAASSVLVKQPVEVVWSSIRQMGNIPSFWTEVLSSDRSDV
ncbi:MAG: hypothetical protein ABI613_04350, partial [Gemmatimonadota bacterium]